MRTLIPILLLFALASSLPAQGTLEAVVQEGDSVPGVGLVTRIDNLVVGDGGNWMVEADTDQANTDTDQVLLKNGVLYLREGQSLTLPAGATLDSFDALTLNANGDSGWNFFLSGTSSTSDDSGIYFNDLLVLQEGTVSAATGFSPGTPYIGFFETKFDNLNRILVMASVDDPAIASTVDRAIVVMSLNASGALIGEQVRWKEGDLLPGQIETVADFGTGPHQFAWNDSGQVLFFADLNGDTTKDGTIYCDTILMAQEGSPSPVAGRNWELLSSRPMDHNNTPDVAYRGNLDGDTADDEVIILNQVVLVREGGSLPAIAPFQITGFGSAPIKVNNDGDVLWYGEWNDPDTTRNSGLFLNDVLLVQEGVTQAGGQTITALSGVQDAFDMSDDGRYILFEGELPGGINAAFLISFSLRMLDPNPGLACTANDFVVEGATPGARVLYAYSLQPGSTNVPGCPGVQVGLKNPVLFGGANASPAGVASLTRNVPCKAQGRTVLLQAAELSTCRVTNVVSRLFP